MNKLIFIGLVLLISPFLTFAHNPLSSKFHLQMNEKVGLLTVNLSQTGVEQVLLKKYSLEDLKAMSPKQFKELIIDYVKSNFLLSIDDTKIELKKGGIKLGTHQTDLKFVLPPFSENSKKALISIPAFKENGEHQTIFIWNFYKEKHKVILSSKNNYQTDIYLSEEEGLIPWLWISLVGFFILIILGRKLILRNK